MGKRPDEEEKAFPRGKPAAPVNVAEAAAADAAASAKTAGKGAGDKAAAAAGSKAKRRRTGTKGEAAADEEEAADAQQPAGVSSVQAIRNAPRLRAIDLVEGSLVVAAVREVIDEELTLNLPFNNLGYVPVAQAVEQPKGTEALAKLTELYSPGQIVVAVVTAVVEVKTGEGPKRQRMELSLRPALLNAGLDADSLVAGMFLPAVVQDEEEHVLRLGFGIPGFQGLLKKKELEGAAVVTKPGCIIQVSVHSVNASAGTARCTIKAPQTLGNDPPLKLEALKAGFLVHARIDKVLPASEEGKNNGLVASFCGSFAGVIHNHHQGASTIKHKQRVSARVLAVVPGATTTVHLTLLPHLLDWESQAPALESFELGHRMEAVVQDSLPRYGLRMLCSADGGKKGKKSSAPVTGFCPASRLPEKEQAKNAEAPEAGSSHGCRVLGYNFLERSLVLTRRPYDLQDDTLVSVNELALGQLVVGTVTRITEYGVFVKLSEYVSALVHLRQLTDVPLAAVPKRVQVDTKLKCRVLRIKTEKRQVALTAKKSLVRDDFQLTSLEQVRRNLLVTGYVSRVLDYGAIVSFFGDVFGLIPKKEMELDEAPAPGMAVKVRVSEINHKRRRMALSLDLENGQAPDEAVTKRGPGGPRVKVGALPGQMVTGVRAVLCTAEGVLVRFRPAARDAAAESEGSPAERPLFRGFIPVGHLSDKKEDAETKHRKLAKKLGGVKEEATFPKDGDEADAGVELAAEAVVLARRCNPGSSEEQGEKDAKDDAKDGKDAKTPSVALLTLKPSMITSVQEESFVGDFAALEESRVYPGYIKEVRDFGALVSVGSWRLSGLAGKGQLTDHFVEKPEEEVSIGQSVRVLVVKLDAGRKRFRADLRPEGSAGSEGQVLRKEVGAPVKMLVQSIKGLEVICTAKGGIRGHLHAVQLVDPESLDRSKPQEPLEELEKKSMIEARILRAPKRASTDADTASAGKSGGITHLELTCRPSLMKDGLPASAFEAAAVHWKGLKTGSEVVGAVAEVRKGVIWLELGQGVRGRVVPVDASTDMSVMGTLPDHFHAGQLYKAYVLSSSVAKKQLDLSLLGADPGKVLKKGAKVVARLEKVESVSGRGLAAFFQLPGRIRGFVHITELYDFWVQNPRKRLRPKTFYEVSVLEPPAEAEGEGSTGRAELSLRPSVVLGRKEALEERRPMAATDLEVGEKVCGYVVNANDKGVFVALSRKLTGRIRLKALGDRVVDKEVVPKLYPAGTLIKDMLVTEVDAEAGRVELSLRKGGNDGSRLTLEQLSVGDVVGGRVKKVEKYGIFVRLDGSTVDGLVHISEVSDSASVTLDSYKTGDRIQRAKVTKIDGSKLWIGIKPSLFDGDVPEDEDQSDDEDAEMEAVAEEPVKEETTPEKNVATAKKKKKAAAAAEEPAAEEPAAEEPAAPAPKRRKPSESKPAKAAATAATADSGDEDAAPWERAAAAVGGSKSRPAAEADQGESAFVFADFRAAAGSSSEDDEPEQDEAPDDNAGKKLTKRQKKAAKQVEAEDVRKREAEVAEGRWANDPRSVEDFERLLLTEGDTSIVWIRYMAFHLKMSDLERARQVAERSVKHVGFSEAQERFNAWVAFMNLECTYGTEESAEALFKRAAAHNDAKQMHLQLARIHERNKKQELATKVYETCCKKFVQSKQVWLAFLTFLYQQNDLEGARKILPKALAALPRLKHPLVVSKAALLEYSHGTPERGRSIFEGLLDSYPKRTDLWSVYMDAHIKAHTPPTVATADVKEVRSLMERCCTMSLKVAKMRFFFKRWLDFETRWGDEESQEKVREKARSFVESQAS